MASKKGVSNPKKVPVPMKYDRCRDDPRPPLHTHCLVMSEMMYLKGQENPGVRDNQDMGEAEGREKCC